MKQKMDCDASFFCLLNHELDREFVRILNFVETQKLMHFF